MQTTFMYTLCVNHLSKKQCSQPRRECWKEFSLTPLFKLISIFYLIVRLYDILHIESLRADGILFSFFPSLPLRSDLKFLSEKFASVFGWCFGQSWQDISFEWIETCGWYFWEIKKTLLTAKVRDWGNNIENHLDTSRQAFCHLLSVTFNNIHVNVLNV